MRILILISFMIMPLSTACKGKGTQEYTEKEKQEMRKDFEIFKKEIILILEEKKSFMALKDYLAGNFYLRNEYHKDFNPEDSSKTTFRYEFSTKKLEIISNELDINVLIYMFKKGEYSVGVLTGSLLYTSNKAVDPSKYPAIDFVYNEKRKKWEIEAIRFEKL